MCVCVCETRLLWVFFYRNDFLQESILICLGERGKKLKPEKQIPMQALKLPCCLVRIAVYLLPLFSLISWGAVHKVEAPLTVEHGLIACWHGQDPACPMQQHQCGSCIWTTPTDHTARISPLSLISWTLTLDKGDSGFISHLTLERLGLSPQKHSGRDWVEAPPGLLMWLCSR